MSWMREWFAFAAGTRGELTGTKCVRRKRPELTDHANAAVGCAGPMHFELCAFSTLLLMGAALWSCSFKSNDCLRKTENRIAERAKNLARHWRRRVHRLEHNRRPAQARPESCRSGQLCHGQQKEPRGSKTTGRTVAVEKLQIHRGRHW